LRSAIIEGELFIRYRRAGDSYFYGGMTHKLKKLFNDKKMPLKERETLPILCDEKGIVWVPGFSVRDDGADAANALNAAFFFSK
jgi:tRNA(Ile)-lysidine synthase